MTGMGIKILVKDITKSKRVEKGKKETNEKKKRIKMRKRTKRGENGSQKVVLMTKRLKGWYKGQKDQRR